MNCSKSGPWWMLGVLSAFGVWACDPCAGTASCRSNVDRIAYTGHVVEHSSGRSVAGVQVTFVRSSGPGLGNDTLRATTGTDGFFMLSADAKSAGKIVGTLHVEPPGRPGYDVAGIELNTTRTAGDGGDLGRFVSDPYVVFVGQIRDRLTGDEFAGGYAAVGFQRTGGVAIEPDTIATQADLYGRFFLAPKVEGPGVVEGRLTVRIEGRGHFVMPLRIETRYRDEAPRDVSIVNWGSALLWVGEVYRRGTNEHIAGIPVDFERTAGINVSPAQFRTTTNEIGYFPIQPSPEGEGELIGTATIHPPGYAPISVPNVRVRTMSDDTVRLAGRFGYGAQAFGLAELRYRTTQSRVAPGAGFTFERVAGVQTLAPVFAGAIKDPGFAVVQLGTTTTGTVTTRVEVKLGEPYGTDTVTIQVPSAEDDSLRFLGTYIVGRWFPYIAQVLDSATHQPIPGATAKFTRTSGVDITPNPYTVTPGTDGIFPLRPQPLADGEVIGDLTLQLPAPYPSTVTIPGLRLRSSKNDTLNFIGLFFVAPKK
jgi:hypothetical protein